jgi:hypothetical protein
MSSQRLVLESDAAIAIGGILDEPLFCSCTEAGITPP